MSFYLLKLHNIKSQSGIFKMIYSCYNVCDKFNVKYLKKIFKKFTNFSSVFTFTVVLYIEDNKK